MTELERLKAEKKELERKIKILECGTSENDFSKIDIIRMGALQKGKWAVYYKYFYTVRRGRFGENEEWEKWVPIATAFETREEAVNEIPHIIEVLQDLYKKAVGMDDPDT